MNVQGKCYKCGGFLAVNDAEDADICPFCSKPIVVEKAIRSFRESAVPASPAQPETSSDTYSDQFFVVEKGVLMSCNCFTEAEITIPNGVRAIGDAAFQGMNNVESVQIPEGIRSIGSSAFSGCKNLREVTIPDGVELVDRDVFNGCTNLRSVHFPDSVKRMEAGAFTGCISLETVNLPSQIESLPWRIFEGCTSLRSVVIPKRVKTIEDYAFAECTALENVQFECPHAEHDPELGVKRIGMNAFLNCTGLTGIDIPETVKYIGNQAFVGCTSLRALTIPKSVKAIYPRAFADCTSLESVTFAGETLLYKGSNPYQYGDTVATFHNCPKLLEVTYDDLQRHFWAFPAYMKSQEPLFMENIRCRHCGGEFEGEAILICTNCRLPKDY